MFAHPMRMASARSSALPIGSTTWPKMSAASIASVAAAAAPRGEGERQDEAAGAADAAVLRGLGDPGRVGGRARDDRAAVAHEVVAEGARDDADERVPLG